MLIPLMLLAAQGGGYDLEGGAHWDGYGRTAFFLQDITGDGVAEFGTSAFCQDSGGVNSGAVYLYDGATRTQLRRHIGPKCNVRLGEAACATGDLDGDGFEDYASGARYTDFNGSHCGSVYVWSGADGLEWLRIDGTAPDEEFGTALASVGDLDGDGTRDLLVGMPGAFGRKGGARLHSGRTGALIRTHYGSATTGEFGAAVASLRDLDQDGYGDYAIASPSAYQGAGRVQVYSGATGVEIGHRTGGASNRRLGTTLVSPGDCDGDGYDDLLIGEPGLQAVHLYSPALDALIRSHELPRALGDRGFGRAVGRCGDVDNDFHADYLLGVPGHWNGVDYVAAGGPALLVSGLDGSLLELFPPTGPDDGFGFALTGGEDLDGDRRPDYLIGAPAYGDLLQYAPGALCVRFGTVGG